MSNYKEIKIKKIEVFISFYLHAVFRYFTRRVLIRLTPCFDVFDAVF